MKNPNSAISFRDLIDNSNSFDISLPWPLGDIELDKSGSRLVAISQDGILINVYTTLKICENPSPIQKFCRSSYPCKLSSPLQIVSIKPDLNLLILCSSLGTIHIFRLLSDQEIYHRGEQISEFMTKKEKNWLWNNIVQNVLPFNLTMTGSPVRIHLNDINIFEKNQESPILMNKPYFAHMKESQ